MDILEEILSTTTFLEKNVFLTSEMDKMEDYVKRTKQDLNLDLKPAR